MGYTISEKILSQHSGKKAKAGDIVVCKVDFAFSQDGTSGLVMDAFERLNRKRVYSKKDYVFVIDHNSPSPTIGTSTVHKRMRTFSRRYGIRLYDIGCGVCHQILPEAGHILPGYLVAGADSHTCTYGAINVFATGMGSTDLAIILASGKNWFRVPETVKIIIRGALKKGTCAKDIALFLLKRFRTDGFNYMAIEFDGDTIYKFSVDQRMTITNMVVEMGAKAGIMKFDKKLEAWLKPRTPKRYNHVSADRDAKYREIFEFDMSRLVPQVAKPHRPDNVAPAEELKAVSIDRAFLGTCTNGRLEDLEVAANVLGHNRIHKDVALVVAPASVAIYLAALKKGYISTFIKAGASIVVPGCGPCVGTHNGIPADGENVISTANRNFIGRMGNPKANIYLASPATVAASAITARITDPRKFL